MDIDTLHIWTHTTHTDTGTHYTYGQTLHTWTQTYTTHMDTDGHRHTLHILRQQGDFISLPSVCKERKVSQICNYSRVSLIVINWNGQNHHKQWSPFQCKMFVCFKNLWKVKHKIMTHPQKARKAGKLFLTKLQTFFGSVKYIRWWKEMMKVGLQESVIS